MPNRFWNTNGFVPDDNQERIGIAIADGANDRIADFQARVAADLATIHGIVPSGRDLIRSIVDLSSRKRVLIRPPRIWAGGWGANECAASDGGAARTHVAEALGSGNDECIINSIRVKLNMSGHQRDWAWLCQQIRATPRYRLQGPVAQAPSNVGLLPLDIERWMDETRPLFYPLKGHEDAKDIKNALLVVLNAVPGPWLVRGAGSHSTIHYDPRKNFNQMGARPAYIGLAHELVHHYYNAQGAQLSHSEDGSHFSTVLFEYMCVGLGPWAGAAISENAIRADDRLPLRDRYV